MPDTDPAVPTTDTTPATFDVEAWFAGTAVPTTTVPVTRDRLAGDRLAGILDEIRTLTAPADDGTPLPRRMAEASPHAARVAELQQERDQVAAGMADGWLYVTIRGLTYLENDTIRHDSAAERNVLALATCATVSTSRDEPGQALPVDQWHRLIDGIGMNQTLLLVNALADLTFNRVVTPDFSQPASASPDGAGSSAS